MNYLIIFSCLVAFALAKRPPSGLYAGQRAYPWYNPIGICQDYRMEGVELSSQVICNQTRDSLGLSPLVYKQYSEMSCDEDDLIRETEIFCDGEHMDCQCYEEWQMPGYTGPLRYGQKGRKSYGEIKFYPAVGPGQTKGNIADTITLMNNTDSESVSIRKNTPKPPPECVMPDLDDDDHFTIQVVTDKCFYYNWGKARQDFEDAVGEVDFDPNKVTFFDLIFNETEIFWYKIRCSRGVKQGGPSRVTQLLWEPFSDPNCSVPLTNTQPLLVEDGCKDWAIFGSYLYADIQCYGEKEKGDISPNSAQHTSPFITFALAAAFAVVRLLQ